MFVDNGEEFAIRGETRDAHRLVVIEGFGKAEQVGEVAAVQQREEQEEEQKQRGL